MTESTYTTLVTYDVPGGIIDAASITYESGTVSYHVGFVTLDSTGLAVRSSLVSQEANEAAALRAADRLHQHFAHVLTVARAEWPIGVESTVK
jgi:hypothetical protein